MAENKSKRKAAFTKAEEAVIRDGYLEFKEIVDAPLSSKVTKRMKDEVWATLADRCNADMMGGDLRSPQDCNRKLRNMKNVLKEKVTNKKKSAKKTGGGPAVFEVRPIL